MMDDVRRSFLGGFHAPDAEVEQRMIGQLDIELDHPPRLDLPEGTVL